MIYRHEMREMQTPNADADRVGETPNVSQMSQEAHEIPKSELQFCEYDGIGRTFGRKSSLRMQQIRAIVELYKTTKLTGREVAAQIGCTKSQVYDTWQQFRNGVFDEFAE